MNTSSTKRMVLFCRKSPYGNALAREALEIALATAVFEQDLAIIFSGDGVWQLQPQQNSAEIHVKSQQKLLAAFAMYDLNEIYVEQEALELRNINHQELSIAATLIDRQKAAELCNSADIILNF
ncbi:MAG: sulfurtransferase complex subunit TusC [Spongiibacteraceae bacterium]|jgi:tRNA 2-thiouridine synthesizing protein C